jgi:hypothetical protein
MAKKSVAKRSEKMERLAQYAKAAKGSSGNIIGKLLKFNKGEWFAGQDEEEVKEGTKMVFNPDSVLVGWTRWEDNKPVEYDMGPIIEGFQPKPRSELGYSDQSDWEKFDDGKPRDPWQFGNRCLLKSIGKGAELYTFIVGSKGGLGAIGRLLDQYTEECMERGEDDYPVITLGKDFYMHPTYKKVWVPDFKIIGWSPGKDFAVTEAAAAPKGKPTPKKGQKALTY